MSNIQDIGLSLQPQTLHKLQTIMATIVGTQNIKRIETSCGTSVVIVTKHNRVYQFYLQIHLFKRIVQLIKLHRLHIDGLVKHHRILYPLQCVVYEKVRPVSVHDNLKQVEQDMRRTLNVLHSVGFSHGDVSLDNIGWSYIQKRYVLFDFETMSKTTHATVERDWYSLDKSLEFWSDKQRRKTTLKTCVAKHIKGK